MSDLVVIDGAVSTLEADGSALAGDVLTFDGEPSAETTVAVPAPADFVVFDSTAAPTILTFDPPSQDFVVISSSGPRGLKGDPGDPGGPGADSTVPGPPGADSTVPGPPGADGTAGGSYTHVQDASLDTWDIVHPLDYTPAVTVVDSIGRVCIGDIEVIEPHHIVITFSAQFSGLAYLS